MGRIILKHTGEYAQYQYPTGFYISEDDLPGEDVDLDVSHHRTYHWGVNGLLAFQRPEDPKKYFFYFENGQPKYGDVVARLAIPPNYHKPFTGLFTPWLMHYVVHWCRNYTHRSMVAIPSTLRCFDYLLPEGLLPVVPTVTPSLFTISNQHTRDTGHLYCLVGDTVIPSWYQLNVLVAPESTKTLLFQQNWLCYGSIFTKLTEAQHFELLGEVFTDYSPRRAQYLEWVRTLWVIPEFSVYSRRYDECFEDWDTRTTHCTLDVQEAYRRLCAFIERRQASIKR